jgi:hypothetical protein
MGYPGAVQTGVLMDEVETLSKAIGTNVKKQDRKVI